jgi:DNA topoisomerase-1
VEVEKAGEDEEQQALYSLIRSRAVASQMADAVFAVRKAVLQSEEQIDGKVVSLEARGRKLTFPGWRSLAQDLAQEPEEGAENEEEQGENPIPDLRQASRLLAQSARVLTKQTKPPARFTEASLVKQLENAGIGRPATYAAILENIIKSKGYLEIDKKRNLVPTETGFTVVEAMDGAFCFMNLDFTKSMEDGLDEVAGGKKTYQRMVSEVWNSLDKELQAFQGKHSHPCPACGKPLRHIVKPGQFDFWGCSGHPECAYSADNDNGRPGRAKQKKAAGETSAHKCKKCGKPLEYRKGISKAGKEYETFSCTGCKTRYWGKAGKPEYDKELS